MNLQPEQQHAQEQQQRQQKEQQHTEVLPQTTMITAAALVYSAVRVCLRAVLQVHIQATDIDAIRALSSTMLRPHTIDCKIDWVVVCRFIAHDSHSRAILSQCGALRIIIRLRWQHPIG